MNRTAPRTPSLLCLTSLLLLASAAGNAERPKVRLVPADDKNIQYTGRVDFSDPKKPRFWAPGVTVSARFRGPSCDAVVDDEVLWGHSHNYVEVAVDGGKPFRVRTTGRANVIHVAGGLSAGAHTVTLCKDTEAGIGYLEFVGFRCAGLLPPPPRPSRKLEFVGDSITCGASSDTSEKPCGKGEWYDQHNAYLAYGPSAARRLHARWQLTSVSGIGMVHSCCGMTYAMPDVFDKLNLAANGPSWDFSKYQPDAVTVCLGQNDGTQDPAKFRATYYAFVRHLRAVYPKAQIVCLTSPMADANLTASLKASLTDVVARANRAGDRRVHAFFFLRSYNGGCGGHPDVDQHQRIAAELSGYLKSALGW